uniref:Uncharacterized protein n=1 Tax=Meloidogyne incognita TaxID=6306 RepID=A0A914NUH3_MELIC
MQIMSLNSYRNSIVNCIYKLFFNDYVSAYQCCIPYIKNCFLNNQQPRGLLMKTTLWPVFSASQPGNFLRSMRTQLNVMNGKERRLCPKFKRDLLDAHCARSLSPPR